MKSTTPRIELLKEMLGLEQKRASLQQELDQTLNELASLKHSIFGESTAPATRKSSSVSAVVKASKAKPAKAASKGSSKRAPRGALRDQIMAALESAGNNGVLVKDLAAAIGTKPVNVHSWFHSNLKRNSSIKKLSGGHYVLNGSSSAKAKTSSAPAAKVKASKPAKAAKPGKKGATTGGRGELSESILTELRKAGNGGVTIQDLSDKIGRPYKNISIWFATTGKRNPGIKRVAKATYRLS